MRILPLLACALIAAACDRPDAAPAADYEVLARYPHDTTAYTQGLLWHDGALYESTGRYASSQLRRVDLATGRVERSHVLASDYFGEGLALVGGRFYQLTWKEQKAFVYDAATLAPVDTLAYAGEGWGLATDGTWLYLSDGSDSIRVLEPTTFRQQRAIAVRFRGRPLVQLNEMEWVDGALLANVYETNWIARIDPATGEVTRVYDFGSLYPDRAITADVLNGIALAPDSGQLLVTGKYWPTLYRVRLK